MLIPSLFWSVVCIVELFILLQFLLLLHRLISRLSILLEDVNLIFVSLHILIVLLLCLQVLIVQLDFGIDIFRLLFLIPEGSYSVE